MHDIKHGAYGVINTAGTKVAAKSSNAIVYIGTAPVHTLALGAQNVNKPMAVNNMAEAKRLFGYSEDWAKYTLCEAMYAHFELGGVGPLVFINVLDPAKHKASQGGSVQQTPAKGRVTIAAAGDIILDSVAVTGKEKGEDYAVAYDERKQVITIAEMIKGALGSEAVTVTYESVDASAVADADVIGESDGEGLNTGLHAAANVYQMTGYIPSFLLAPGFAETPEVHAAMAEVSQKINGHWDAYMMCDLPLTDDEGDAMTMTKAAAYKAENGYNLSNEKVFFPMAEGTDGRKYHLSVLAAANFQKLLVEQGGIPYKTASNTACPIIANLYMGADNAGRVFDDAIINDKLNRHGVTSAAFVGGRWAIWGSQSADYDAENAGAVSVADTNIMMLFYVTNDFQHRRAVDVDKQMTANDVKSVVAEEQARLDALVKSNALVFGEAYMSAEANPLSDIMKGDYAFSFRVATTPLAKSLTAIVTRTEDGYAAYYADFM